MADRSPASVPRNAPVLGDQGRSGHVDIDAELCKGCEFCVDVCPEECLAISDLINSRGYRFALYEGDRCTGCGVCYYNCPEPGAIAVFKATHDKDGH